MRIFIISILLLLFSISSTNSQTVSSQKNKISQTTVKKKEGSPITLTLRALIEAMYVCGGTAMPINPTVTVELHGASTPYALVESRTGPLSTAGLGTFTYSTAVNGTPYYIVVKSINTLETWSATAQSFTGGALSYDFTTGVDKAYTDGSNAPLSLHSGKYCIYSGDVSQDGFITNDDFTGVDNDASVGDWHTENDVNGDNFVTNDDFTFIDNNASVGVMRQIPVIDLTIVNYEGQTYHTVLIGSHYWLKENLNVGTMLTRDQSQTDNGIIEKYCYEDDPNNCDIYGGLYLWNETMGYSSNPKGICPAGWHVPTIIELNTLSIAVNGDGNALKDVSQGFNNEDHNGKGTNTSGFSAFLSGTFFFNYADIGTTTSFWSSTEVEESAYILDLFSYNNNANQDAIFKEFGLSVRCVMD
jgi:uncharacterized protein (TIGR02145 family)